MEQDARQKRFRRLAEALVMVMQHSATPHTSLIACREIAQIVADHADLPTTFYDAPRPGLERVNLQKLYIEFGLAYADAMDDDDLDTYCLNKLLECSPEVEYLLRPENEIEADAGRIRGIVKEYARIWATPDPPPPPLSEDQQILRRFAKATYQLLAHPGTPAPLCDAISGALNNLGNELFLFDYAPEVEARVVLRHFFAKPETAPALPKRNAAPIAPASPTATTDSDFAGMAESLAANLQDDGLLESLIRLAYRIADEPDRLKREGLAVIVSAQSYLRTTAFTDGISGILQKREAIAA